jgi:site-specific DNA-methyltransferase (cytosine-N4-specific)
LPEFFIKFLTDPGDVVLDIFAGSNTTGEAAEGHGRKWLAFEKEKDYLAASSFRFLENNKSDSEIQGFYGALLSEKEVEIRSKQSALIFK